MSSNNSSNNRINVPEAKQGMEQFKMRSANEVGVNLKNGCNGSVVGQMVKKCVPQVVRSLSGRAGLRWAMSSGWST